MERPLSWPDGSVAGPLGRWARHRPDAVAIRFEGTETTYRQLHERIVRLGAALADHDVGRGDRVAFLGLNHPATLELLFAAARQGAALTPVNNRLTDDEVQYVLDDCEPSLLVVTPPFAGVAARLRTPRIVTTDELVPAPSPGDGARGADTNGVMDDPLLIVYTSGTTGRPKGAVLTQRAVAANATNAAAMFDLVSSDHVLTVLPLFHVGGLNIQTTPALLCGASVTIHERFDPSRWLAGVAGERVTLSVLVPTMLQAVLTDPAWPGADLSSLRLLATGSSTVPAELIEPFHRRGVPVAQVYGATETGPIAVHQRRETALADVGRTGHPAVLTDVKLDGGTGEVLARGPNVFGEYWRNPSATADAFTADGWYRSGDLGRWAPSSQLEIVDRLRDIVITGGENVYPAEVERVLHDCPGVADVAVVGRPDPRWGEIPVAVVTETHAGAVDAAAVAAHLAAGLARYKHPHELLVVDVLPRTALGKVRKDILRHDVARLATDAHRVSLRPGQVDPPHR